MYKPLHDIRRTVLEAMPNDPSGWNNLGRLFLNPVEDIACQSAH